MIHFRYFGFESLILYLIDYPVCISTATEMKFTFILLVCCFPVLLSCGCRARIKPVTPDETVVAGQPPLPTSAKPPVMRSIECFNRIKAEMTMDEVIKICGLPDDDIGSGIHIYIYQLSNGSTVRIGTPDRKRLFYVVHLQPNEKAHYLIGKSPH